MTEPKELYLAPATELDIVKTFECGQCFRWNADENGVYSGIAYGWPARVYERDGRVYILSCAPEGLWREYFDLNSDYDELSRGFEEIPYLNECMQFGRGIRILRQEPFEALCSFIISQCNNITRIKGIVERLCSEFGESVEFLGDTFYKFPSAERLASLLEADLACLRSGYRAPYIINAAREVQSGELDLEALKQTDCVTAKNRLKQLQGIGDKVANCVVLFGLYHMEAFPIDVWIRRALREHFPPDFNPDTLGPYAGLAQQYIFYYARSGDGKTA